jgi:hypothetical protein
MSETHNADEVCPIIEKHKRNETAKVWFSGAVVRAFKTYDERASLVGALGDEINQISSDYIPYLLLDFRQMTFICATLWSEEEEIFLMEIDLAAEAVQVGEVFVPVNENNEFDEEDFEPVTVH